jgi:outer membrane protein assembly factor BamD (BamD/ComL family)
VSTRAGRQDDKMTRWQHDRMAKAERPVTVSSCHLVILSSCLLVCFCGCQSAAKTEASADSSTDSATRWISHIDHWHWFDSPPPPPPPADSLVLHGDRLEPEIQAAKGKAAADLAGAHVLYRDGKFSEAEKFFHRVAENTKNSPPIAEEARYYEAECLRRQAHYPRAADTYARMLNDFPSGAYREQAVQHMFEIANYWLDDTRKEMGEYKEEREGKRWVVWPEFVHFEKTKPLLDEEGRAVEKLEQVRYNDMTGPLADKALFLQASVKFYRKEYKEAQTLYSQLVEMHKNSPFVEQAIELAIISKQLSTGGSDYDGRQLAEARKMIDTALRNYPEFANKKGDFLTRQLFNITMQQAAKDYDIAEFYRRTGHPCSAYFCYEIVRRRYPGTKYFDQAAQRMQELRAKIEKTSGAPAGAMVPPDKHESGLLPAAPSPNLLPGQLPPGIVNPR